MNAVHFAPWLPGPLCPWPLPKSPAAPAPRTPPWLSNEGETLVRIPEVGRVLTDMHVQVNMYIYIYKRIHLCHPRKTNMYTYIYIIYVYTYVCTCKVWTTMHMYIYIYTTHIRICVFVCVCLFSCQVLLLVLVLFQLSFICTVYTSIYMHLYRYRCICMLIQLSWFTPKPRSVLYRQQTWLQHGHRVAHVNPARSAMGLSSKMDSCLALKIL